MESGSPTTKETKLYHTLYHVPHVLSCVIIRNLHYSIFYLRKCVYLRFINSFTHGPEHRATRGGPKW